MFGFPIFRRRMHNLFNDFDREFDQMKQDPFFSDLHMEIDDLFDNQSQSNALKRQQLAIPQNSTLLKQQDETKTNEQALTFWPSSSAFMKGMSIDVVEKDKEFIIQADMPGIKKEDVKLDINNGVLTITAQRKQELISSSSSDKELQNWRRMERTFGLLSRSLRLPNNVDSSKILAKQDNGVLTIFLPKTDQLSRIRTIQIQ